MIDVNVFIKEYGLPTEAEKPGRKFLEEYKGLVPDPMIEFWERFGFGCYADGLIWVINPKQLGEVLSEWLPRKEKQTPAVPVIRTAFGKLIYWHKNNFTLLDVNYNDRFDTGDDVELLFVLLLIGTDAREGILQEPLFKKALTKFGPLKSDEMYGYKLPLAMGGNRDLMNLAKMKMVEQLSILAQIHIGAC